MRISTITPGRIMPVLALLFLLLTGIRSEALAQQGRPAPTVAVTTVGETELVEQRRYNGQLQSPSQVALVARVSGELLEVGFEDGDMVKAGQVLYRLDDVRYDASVKAAEATIERCKASLQYAESNYKRIKSLYEKNVTTLDAFESATMTLGTDRASLHSAEAALITAKDDLKNTKVVAPIDGKISVTRYTVGNYLTPSSGTLATIVSLNPLRLSFALSNRDYLDLFGGSEDNFCKNAVIQVKLANGEIYEKQGTFEFRDNEVNRTTDTIPFYILIPNEEYKLMPGSAVTVLLTKKDGSKIATIPQTAVCTDNRSNFVYVLDANNIPTRRDIVLGPSDGKNQMVRSGVKVGERIVSDGWHKVTPGVAVKPSQE